jgi:FixJ family two-component response regulator
MKPLVHVIEDDSSLRTALTRLLRRAGFEARSYGSAGEYLATEQQDVPGCMVLDVGLPGLSGVDLQSALARREDAPSIVFLTGRGDIDMSVRAMKAGAVDFLTKPVRREPLLAAIHEALARDASKRTRNEASRLLRARFERLTAREREVYDRVVGGKLNREIADELQTSLRTIKAHRAQVMKKMEVESLAQLVGIADRLREAARRSA